MAKKDKHLVNPHETETGYETSRANKIAGGWNVLYRKENYDIETGKWDVLCATHSTLVNCRLKRKAESMLLYPTDWCVKCRDIASTEEAKKILVDGVVERPIDDQIRMLAKLAKGDPEKCAMFEELHHAKPDQFWD